MKIAAKIISYVFHPLMMPVIGLSIIFNTDSYINYAVPQELKQAVIILVGASTFLIPLLISLLLLNRKLINSLEMETQKERVIPSFNYHCLLSIYPLHVKTGTNSCNYFQFSCWRNPFNNCSFCN